MIALDEVELVKDENGDFVQVRDYIERILAEREKQLLQRSTAENEALVLAAANAKDAAVLAAQRLEERLGKVRELDQRLGTFETRLMWLIVVGSLCVALAGLIGGVVGFLTK